mgnify:FL=1|jgi:6-phosphogluconolactonase/glucosamine-6-phosphate isomerase/deaminase
MKIIEILDIEHAAEVTKSIFFNLDPEHSKNIAFTGGRFGKKVLSKFSIEDLTNDYEIFQTDERIVSSNDNDCIQTYIIKELFNTGIPNRNRLNFFNIDTNLETSVEIMTDLLNRKKIVVLDIVFLSLGEDGHIAGHFNNSLPTDDQRICITHEAIKLPKKRISYNVSWLLKSKLIILCVIGSDKEKAYNELFNGEGLHSESIKSQDNLIILKDKKFR